MNRNEFITALRSELRGLPEAEINEILYDYEEHFRIGLENGQTEEEICRKFGDVKDIARQYFVTYRINHAEHNMSAANIFKAVLATAGLGFFNLVFVLWLFITIIAILVALFTTSVSLTAGGIFAFFAILLSPFFPIISIGMNPVSALAFSVFLTAFGILFTIGNCYVAVYVYKVIIKYLKWNLDIIMQKKS
ncbi:MAG: DUF1700 domain-containing protein [Spirochaetes bacterium]|nr:DUF1700 domain-containing protein [Spirochaetota bacterium]